MAKSFDSKGFYVTSAPVATSSSVFSPIQNNAVQSQGSSPAPEASTAFRSSVSSFLAVSLAASLGFVSVLL